MGAKVASDAAVTLSTLAPLKVWNRLRGDGEDRVLDGGNAKGEYAMPHQSRALDASTLWFDLAQAIQQWLNEDALGSTTIANDTRWNAEWRRSGKPKA